MNSRCSGQAELSASFTRRTLTVTTALMAVEIRAFLAIATFCQFPGTGLACRSIPFAFLARQLLDSKRIPFEDDLRLDMTTSVRSFGHSQKRAVRQPQSRGFPQPLTMLHGRLIPAGLDVLPIATADIRWRPGPELNRRPTA